MNDILTWSQIQTREEFEKLKKEKLELLEALKRINSLFPQQTNHRN